jgi:ADP-ribosylglycohydrolase
MLGTITGDIVGSIYEFDTIKTVDFPLFGDGCRFTDDTVLTVALAEAIMTGGSYASLMKEYYRRYPEAGYGGRFHAWASGKLPGPYQSWGNGAAMRISPVGYAFDTIDLVLEKAEEYTIVTHDHPEGIRGAQATAAAIYLARTGATLEEIRRYITGVFGYDLSRSCDVIRRDYTFDESCQGTVPQAITAFLESGGFEDAIRLAVSLGGDSDTLACITGGIAEAFYGGVPPWIAWHALDYLDEPLRQTALAFTRRYGVTKLGAARS